MLNKLLHRIVLDLEEPHPFAVSGDHVFGVGKHPGEAVAAYDHVSERGLVPDDDPERYRSKSSALNTELVGVKRETMQPHVSL